MPADPRLMAAYCEWQPQLEVLIETCRSHMRGLPWHRVIDITMLDFAAGYAAFHHQAASRCLSPYVLAWHAHPLIAQLCGAALAVADNETQATKRRYLAAMKELTEASPLLTGGRGLRPIQE